MRAAALPIYKRNINIHLPHVNKVFGRNSVFHTGLSLCRSLNINIDKLPTSKVSSCLICM